MRTLKRWVQTEGIRLLSVYVQALGHEHAAILATTPIISFVTVPQLLLLDKLRNRVLDLLVRKTCATAISPSPSPIVLCQIVPSNDSLFSLPNAAMLVSKSVLGPARGVL